MNSRRRMPGTSTFPISEVSARRTLLAAPKRGYYDGKCNHRGKDGLRCVRRPLSPEPVLYRDAIERIDSARCGRTERAASTPAPCHSTRAAFDTPAPQITYRSIARVYWLSRLKIGQAKKAGSYFPLSDPIHGRPPVSRRDFRGFSRRKRRRDDIAIISFTIHPF